MKKTDLKAKVALWRNG